MLVTSELVTTFEIVYVRKIVLSISCFQNFKMKDFGHLNYGINPKVPAERKIEWVNSLDGHGNESVTESTYKSYSTKAQNKRFEVYY